MTGVFQWVREFCQAQGGEVRDITLTCRPNHQKLAPPGDGWLTCVTAHVWLRNLGLFGMQAPFLTEVYPRYRHLGTQLEAYLADRGCDASSAAATLAVSLVPYPAVGGELGAALPKLERPARGQATPPMAELARQSAYYAGLAARYAIEYGVVTNNGTVIGPDGGIVAAACLAAEAFDHKVRVVEVGTGAGSTATALLGRNKLAQYWGNDFSPEMADFFERKVRPQLTRAGVAARLETGSCYDLKLEAEADLLVVGVFYQAQPDLFQRQGRQMAACLKDRGVLVVQSGKPENPFTTRLLHDPHEQQRGWPWHDAAFRISNYFEYVSEQVVEDETVLLATNNYDLFRRCVRLAGQHFARNGFRLAAG